MKSTTKQTQRDYSPALKLAVIDQVEKGEMTYKQAQDKYGIQGRSTVLVWLRKHGKLDWSSDNASRKPGLNTMSESHRPLTPEQRQIKDNIIVEWVKRERHIQPRIGVRKLHHLLNQGAVLGFHIGRDRLFDVLRAIDYWY